MLVSQLIITLLVIACLLVAAYYFKHHSPTPTPVLPHSQPSVSIAPMSAALSEMLKRSLAEIQGCQAIAYVDTQHNRLIGIETSTPFPSEILTLVAATVTELFTAPNLLKMSAAFKQFKAQDVDKSNFNEMVIRGEGSLYVLLRAHSNDHRVFVFACTEADVASNNVGLILHQARLLMPQIEVAAEAAFLVE